MPKTETKSLEELIREELAEAIKLPYFQGILAKDDTELLSWLHWQCENQKSVIAEGFHYFEPEHWGKLELGTRILRSHLVEMLFVLNEFRKRRGFDASVVSE